jgi:hypothetical protein
MASSAGGEHDVLARTCLTLEVPRSVSEKAIVRYLPG